MADQNASMLMEVREMLKVVSDRQIQLMEEISQLKEDQKKLLEEIKISNFVLNNITVRSEILN